MLLYARTLKAEQWPRVEGLGQEWRTAWQHAFRPTTNLHHGISAKEFLPFKKALVFLRSLEPNPQKEQQWCKTETRPANMPSDPRNGYTHTGWQGHGHLLDTGNFGVPDDHRFVSSKQALLYALINYCMVTV